MKWNRYIFSMLMLMLILLILINNNIKVRDLNYSILRLSNKIIIARDIRSNIDNLMYSERALVDEVILERLERVFSKLEVFKDLEDIKVDISTDLESIFNEKDGLNLFEIKNKFNELIFNLEIIRNDYINKIRKSVFNRNLLFIFLILASFISLIYEVISFNLSNKKLSFYLKNLVYKKYDFEIKKTKLPYMDSILEETINLKRSLKVVDNAIQNTLNGYNIKSTLESLFNNEEFRLFLSFERIGFAKVEDDFFVADISLSDDNNIKLKRGFKIKRKNSKSLRELIKKKEIRIINDLKEYYKNNPNSESTNLILKEGYLSSLTAPLYKSNGKIVGILFFSSKKKNNFSEIDKYRIATITDIVSSIFEKNMLIEDLVTNSALTFVKLVEGKDPETSNHLERMAEYSRIIAKYLSYEDKYKDIIDYFYMDNLCKFAPLHDIGKIGIPDSILLKPGKLTDEEFQIMKEHPKIGAKVLNYYQNNLKKYEIDTFKMAVKITISHHEKWDGTGYPNGLKGFEIPIEGRITAVADVFDAISSKRIYKEAMSFDKSVSIIKEMSGTYFDPQVVEVFLKGLDEIKETYNKLKEI